MGNLPEYGRPTIFHKAAVLLVDAFSQQRLKQAEGTNCESENACTCFYENEDFIQVTVRKAIPLHGKKTFEGVASCKPRPLYVQVKRRRRLLDPRAGTDVTLSRFEPRFLCSVHRPMFAGGGS